MSFFKQTERAVSQSRKNTGAIKRHSSLIELGKKSKKTPNIKNYIEGNKEENMKI